MNIKLLKAEFRNLNIAYILYFILQAPYAYVGKMGYQILYWMVTWSLYATIFSLFGGGVETQRGSAEIFGLLVMVGIFAIWPVNLFFALPNLVKKENLRVYEIMSKKEGE